MRACYWRPAVARNVSQPGIASFPARELRRLFETAARVVCISNVTKGLLPDSTCIAEGFMMLPDRQRTNWRSAWAFR